MTLIQGTVFKKTIGSYTVHTDAEVMVCTISSKLRKHFIYLFGHSDPTSASKRVMAVDDIQAIDPIAIGDHVVLTNSDDGTGMIVEVLPRRNKLSRVAADPKDRGSQKPMEQVIVANVDQIIPVFAAASPAPKWNMLDRYLATAEMAEIPSIVCITKMDLVDTPPVEIEIYQQIGYPVYLTSTSEQQGLEAFRAALGGKISVFVGKSGVGKTSLLNAIEPGLGLRVNEVNQRTGKGKHTTTHQEMFPLQTGGGIVDTPGMREFGLWTSAMEDDLAYFFREMRPLIGKCQFGLGCSHTTEPGCAITEAVEQGTIAATRYHSYLKMQDG
ncbi:MAG: ribosome small subunit-dependent GTPase A [Chloroflexi bacterium]|nr:ribosome small subunit-dependent GTPase A [Chloroflexota bacterium]